MTKHYCDLCNEFVETWEVWKDVRLDYAFVETCAKCRIESIDDLVSQLKKGKQNVG